jgi:hypothetical protein
MMTINGARRTAVLLSDQYEPQLDANGEWTETPKNSANDARLNAIVATIEGHFSSESLSDWAKAEYTQWKRDALELMALGVVGG